MKLDKFCSKDDLRPAMNYIQCKGGYFFATDAHIGAKVKATAIFSDAALETLGDEFYIHANEWKTLFSKPPINLEVEGSIITATLKNGDKRRSEYLDADKFATRVGRYPDLDSVLRDLITYIPEGGINQIGIDLKLAQRVNEAFDNLVMRLEFKGERKGILAMDTAAKLDAIAVIMPCAVMDAVEYKEHLKKFA
jgi:hypothetical protein